MAVNPGKYEVSWDSLCGHCDPAGFDFGCTRDVAPLEEFIGQERAIKAIEFGLSMKKQGYNIFLAGLSGTGKTTVARTYIKKMIDSTRKNGNALNDWCYVFNVADADHPEVVSLPQGNGKEFRDQVSNLLQMLKDGLTKAFSTDGYKSQRKTTVENNKASEDMLFGEFEGKARQKGFMIQMSPMGPSLVPIAYGRPMSEQDFVALGAEGQRSLQETRDALFNDMQLTIEKARETETTGVEELKKMDRAVADYTVSHLFNGLKTSWAKNDRVVKYLNDLQGYTMSKLELFKQEERPQQMIMGMPGSNVTRGPDPFLPFQVNVFVDNTVSDGPPVVIEPNPTYYNLFGKIERRFLFGGYTSDHTMIKPGAVHKANGGYLLVNASDVMLNPAVWPTLKRVIKFNEVRIEEPQEQGGLVPPHGLRPQPMPVETKVVLIGEPSVYQRLAMQDEDFGEMFKVKAEFDDQVARTKKNLESFAGFVSRCCKECTGMLHFDRTGVAKIVDFASREVEDREKLSARFGQIKQLIDEAEYWASREGAELVTGQHVEKAIDQKIFRHNLPDERVKELIARGDLMIDVKGKVVGQVNGLAVSRMGDITFSRPSRITCKTFLGRGGVINIEREAQLSGRTHDKGVLILGGYMGWKYAQDNPLSLSASLCFEQSYDGVDGDSASSTELYALLSSLSEVPIKQNIAVTGSVNQKGELQSIGGVNYKIEGFFQVCRTAGLTGDQGVMIPSQNLENLMLREEVVNAVKEGRFHIYAVSSIDQGIEVLTGRPAGRRGKNGYPEGTINFLVETKLKENAVKLKQFYAPEEKQEVVTEIRRDAGSPSP